MEQVTYTDYRESFEREAAMKATMDQQAATIASQAGTIMSQGMSISGMSAALTTLHGSAPQIIAGTYTVGAVPKTIGGVACSVLPTPGLDNLGKYARVYDLFGSVVDLVKVAAFVQSNGALVYRWKPLTGAGLAQVVSTTAAMTIKPLESPTDIVLTADLSGAMNVAIDKTLAFPGHTLRIRRAGGGLGTLNLLVGVTNLLAVLLNASTLVGYDPFNDTYVQLS